MTQKEKCRLGGSSLRSATLYSPAGAGDRSREATPPLRVTIVAATTSAWPALLSGVGRKARFLMNAMLASGGYPWTVIRVEDRDAYMKALESASVPMDIGPFASFIAERVKWSMDQAAKPAKKS